MHFHDVHEQDSSPHIGAEGGTQELLVHLARLAPLPLQIFAPDGTCVFYNDAFAAFFAWKPKGGFKLEAAADASNLPPEIARAFAGESVRFGTRMWCGKSPVQEDLWQNGDVFPHMTVALTPVAPKGGMPPFVVASFLPYHDAVESYETLTRQKAELEVLLAEHRKTSELLALAQRIAHLGSWELYLHETKDLDSHTLRWSDEAYRIFGYEPGEIEVTVSSFFSAVHPDDREDVNRATRAAIAARGDYSIEHRIIHRDGSCRHVHEQSSIIYDAVSGEPLIMRGTVHDITDRKRAQEALRSSEERFRTLVGSLDDLVFTLDKELRITGVFGRWAERSRIVVSTILGKSIADAFEPLGDPEAHVFACAKALRGETVVYEWVLGAGNSRTLSVSMSPLHDAQGEVSGLVGVGREITAQRASESQLLVADRLASVGMLAAGITHEINTPLAAIHGYLEVAQRQLGSLNEAGGFSADQVGELRATLRCVAEATAQVRSIVRDVNLFARPDDDGSIVEIQPVIESVLRMAWSEINPRARLVTDFGKVPPVHGNASRLGQVFLNLVVNAAQAIPEGAPTAHTVTVKTVQSADGRVAVMVSDTGRGIDAADRDQLFTPFFTRKKRGEGLGLGLSICQRIVTAIGGEIDVDSQPGGGTTFTVRLRSAAEGMDPMPSQDALLYAADVPFDPAAFLEPTTAGVRILVIDDEPMIGGFIAESLRPYHDVTVELNGAAALTRLAAGERFDLILCDVMMPQMSIMELYERMTKIDAKQTERIVFMSGGAYTTHTSEFLESMPHARLDKPFEASQILALIAALPR